MDGKTANASDRKSSKDGSVSKMNAMSLYSVKNKICEKTEFIEEKTNEIPTGPKLIKMTNVRDCVVVFDALNTQTETIKAIIKSGGHYVAPVKGNQPNLEENIKDYFENKDLFSKAKKENYYVVKEVSHGVLEKREYIFTNDIDWIYEKKEWLSLKSIGIAIRTYENKNGEKVRDIRYFISDIDAKYIDLISKPIRGEWAIENEVHWYLDMVFAEDKNKCFLNNSQKNLNIIRKFCLSILKLYKKETNLSMNSIRFSISLDYEKEIEKLINFLYNN